MNLQAKVNDKDGKHLRKLIRQSLKIKGANLLIYPKPKKSIPQAKSSRV